MQTLLLTTSTGKLVVGAYHINADSFDKNEYRYVRNAISIMNPPIK